MAEAQKENPKVTYIGHSGFSVELRKVVLLFDYYRGEIPVFSEDASLYVFASHRPPPDIPTGETVWWGERKGRASMRGRSAEVRPRTE